MKKHALHYQLCWKQWKMRPGWSFRTTESVWNSVYLVFTQDGKWVPLEVRAKQDIHRPLRVVDRYSIELVFYWIQIRGSTSTIRRSLWPRNLACITPVRWEWWQHWPHHCTTNGLLWDIIRTLAVWEPVTSSGVPLPVLGRLFAKYEANFFTVNHQYRSRSLIRKPWIRRWSTIFSLGKSDPK